MKTKGIPLKICFFGASVTAQSTGFATILKDEMDADVKIFGYGGMHLKDAGICYIEHVLDWNPSICFVDWFSTGYNECSDKTEELLDTIIYRFTKASCKLVFFFLPYKENELKKDFYSFCKKILKKRNVLFIDIYNNLRDKNIKFETILRDTIHTNDYGSRLYADMIKASFEKIRDKLALPIEIQNTKYTQIKSIVVEKNFQNNFC